MKKILKIGVIFLLCVQILIQNVAWAGGNESTNESNSDIIRIAVYHVGESLSLKMIVVHKKHKIFSLDKIFPDHEYIFSGNMLNRHGEIGQLLKEDDCILAISPKNNQTSRWMDVTERNKFKDIAKTVFGPPSILRERARLKDIWSIKAERPRRRHGRVRKGPVFNSLHSNIDVSKDKSSTIIPEKVESASEEPLPILW